MKLVSRRAMGPISPATLLACGIRCNAPRSRSGLTRATSQSGSESIGFVNPMVTPSEIGEDLVTDGPHPGGEIVDSHAVANECGKIAAPDGALGKLGDVHGQHVHRYAPGEGAALSADDDIGRGLAFGGAGRPQEAIRVADRHDGYTARPCGGESCAITDGFTLIDRAHLDDAALELHDRTHGIFLARGRVDAVERHARPN